MSKAIVFTACDAGNDLYSDSGRNSKKQEWKELLKAYMDCPVIGLLFVFITDGYRGVLSGKDSWINMDKERRMREILEEIKNEIEIKKLQIIGTKELTPTMGSLERAAGKVPLGKFLLSDAEHLYYDAPKFIEAIVRIARGYCLTDQLIFRMDSDVFPSENAFLNLIDFHSNLPSDATNNKRFFFFSGVYGTDGEVDLINDSAVRAHHFALPEMQSLYERENPERFNVAKKWLESIRGVGPDPFSQVISGAGLCMSYNAICELPPFSNIKNLVVWIDDQLKRRLHECLGHVPKIDSKNNGYRFCSSARFRQNRYPRGVKQADIDDASEKYFPRLVRGCLMNSLIEEFYAPGVRQLKAQRLRMENTILAPRVVDVANKCFDEICELWGTAEYSSYPIGAYVRETLPDMRASFIETAADDVHLYLDLVGVWADFVDLFKHIDPKEVQNEWLFRSATD